VSRPPASSWLYDDLLAWLSPGGLLLTALVLRFPRPFALLREQAPELTLPTWLAGAYVVGVALSPLGRVVYGIAQAVVWSRLKGAWAPAIAFLSERLAREGVALDADVARMSSLQFHEADRRLREYVEAVEPSSAPVMHRMKVLCSLSCNAAAACCVFAAVDAIAQGVASWGGVGLALGMLVTASAFFSAVYRERRRQRTQLSIWRRLQIPPVASVRAS
jgi:hypothetical protein